MVENSQPTQYNALTSEEEWYQTEKRPEMAGETKFNHKNEGLYICTRCNSPLFESSMMLIEEVPNRWPHFNNEILGKLEFIKYGNKHHINCANCKCYMGETHK